MKSPIIPSLSKPTLHSIRKDTADSIAPKPTQVLLPNCICFYPNAPIINSHIATRVIFFKT